MKNTSILATIVMVVIGVGGIVGSTSGFGTFSNSNGKTAEQSGLFEGHFTVTAKHPDGTVYAYEQSDNTVTIYGKTCVAALAFGTNSTHSTCYGTTAPKFTWIGLGNGSAVVPTVDTDYTLSKEAIRQNASSVQGATSGVGSVNATTGGHAYAVIQNLFTIPTETVGGWNGTTFSIKSGTILSEAGLFDGSKGPSASVVTNNAHMFAHTALASTVTVNPGDQVTVKYSIAIG